MSGRERDQERSKTENEIRKLSREQQNETEDAASAGAPSAKETFKQRDRRERIAELRRRLADIDAAADPNPGS
jgi:hypothetical protein